MISEQIPVTPDDNLIQFGMLYEKYIFSKIVRDLVAKYKIKSVCEFPCNQLMGKDNNEYFRENGCEVDRYRLYPEGNTKKYDLIWNFCEFENCPSSQYLVSKMKNLSRSYLLVITQNRYNVLLLHYWYHVYKGTAWDHGVLSKMNNTPIKREFRRQNIEVRKVGAFDVPWFVLDFYEGGKFFRGMAPKTMIKTQDIKESFFEKLPKPFKLLLAHHHYVLGRRG